MPFLEGVLSFGYWLKGKGLIIKLMEFIVEKLEAWEE